MALFASCTAVEEVRADRAATLWTTTEGEFFDATNWNLGLPSTLLDARIDNGAIVRITSPSEHHVQYVYLGSEQNTSGTLEISGSGSANFTTMIVGALNATGTLKIFDGGKLTSFGGPIGSDYLGVGVATIDGVGSSWTLTGAEMALGGNSKGTLFLTNGGALTVQNGTGRIRMANHPLSEGNLFVGNGGVPGTLSASEILNGEGRATVYFNHTNAALNFPAKFTGLNTINGHLNINHDGPGTTILSAPESNLAGIIKISVGTLLVNGRIVGSEKQVLLDEEEIIVERTAGTTVVENGGTLGGIGFIEGKTTVRGILSPGIGVGILEFGTDLILESSGTVTMELGGEVRGVDFDGLDVAGELLYAGTLKLLLRDGFQPVVGDMFDLFDGFETYSGTFADIEFSEPGYAGAFDPETGVLSITQVPEPGAFALVALAGAATSLRRVRKSYSPGRS